MYPLVIKKKRICYSTSLIHVTYTISSLYKHSPLSPREATEYEPQIKIRTLIKKLCCFKMYILKICTVPMKESLLNSLHDHPALQKR